MRAARGPVFLLLGVGVGVYANTLGNELIFDAKTLIAHNPLLGDLGRVPELLRSDYWKPELVSGRSQ